MVNSEKVVLIVGGSGGIGLETAKLLSKKGYITCLTYNTNKKEIDDAKIENSESFRMNIIDEKSIKITINRIIEKYGRIDSLVYTISDKIKNKQFFQMEWDDFQAHLDVQLRGFFLIVKEMEKLIIKDKIKFIPILTEYCFNKPPSGISHYISSKYALMGLVKSLASEFGKTKCTFNMISPGMVDTRLLSNLPPKLIEMTAYQNPMKKIAEPVDVAKVIVFLVSEESDYINGENILVNGGNIFR